MNKTQWISFSVTALLLAAPGSLRAESDLSKDTKEAISDVKKGARKTGRKVKDKSCELVDGKMSCAGKKMKHKVENAADDVKDAVN
jgi:gas vesicle protein